MAGCGTWVPTGRRRRALSRSAKPIDGDTSITSRTPSLGWARGATSSPSTNSAFIAATIRPRHHDRRATRCATNQCWRPSTSTEPRSTGTRIDSRFACRPTSPRPPSVRHRSPPARPSGGGRSPARRAASTTRRASASLCTTTPSSGSAPGSPHASPFRMVKGLRPGRAPRRRRPRRASTRSRPRRGAAPPRPAVRPEPWRDRGRRRRSGARGR